MGGPMHFWSWLFEDKTRWYPGGSKCLHWLWLHTIRGGDHPDRHCQPCTVLVWWSHQPGVWQSGYHQFQVSSTILVRHGTQCNVSGSMLVRVTTPRWFGQRLRRWAVPWFITRWICLFIFNFLIILSRTPLPPWPTAPWWFVTMQHLATLGTGRSTRKGEPALPAQLAIPVRRGCVLNRTFGNWQRNA